MTTIDRFRTAEFHLAAGNPLRALEELAPLHEELDGHSAGQLLLARAYYHSAQLGRARSTLERLVEREPTDHYARFLLGRTLERQSRYAEAATHYQVAVALRDDPDYRERLESVRARVPVAVPDQA